MLGLKLVDFTGAHTGANPGEKRQGEERHQGPAVDLLYVAHECGGLLGTERFSRTSLMGDAQVRHLFQRVGGDPVLTEGELEKGKQDAAPVVEGLRLGVAAVAVSGEGVTGELGEIDGLAPNEREEVGLGL